MSYYGLGLDERWATEQVNRAIWMWRKGRHKPFESLEQFLHMTFPEVADDALWHIKRLEQEESK